MKSSLKDFKELVLRNKIALMAGAGAVLPYTSFASVTAGEEYKTVLTGLTSAVSVADVAAILAVCVAAGVSFFFLWFGSRKAVGSFIAALTKGKIKL